MKALKRVLERNRIVLTRGIGLLILIFYFESRSYWDANGVELFAYVLYAIGLILVGIGALGRMWCSLYIAGYKDRKLIDVGPYSIVRNPLYLFSFIGAVGVGLATETLTFPLLIAILFLFYYPVVIKREERKLEELFGEEYEKYKQRVPSVIPSFSSFYEPERYEVNPRVFRKHMFSALWFIWIVGILELLEALKDLGYYTPIWTIY
ncbi:methyltransferase family protein [Nitratifractor sp.]